MKILIVAEHASARFGGEAILPLHYFRLLRRRGVEAWLVVHARTQAELSELLPAEADRIRYIPDLWLHKLLWRMSRFLPSTVSYWTTGLASRLITQLLAVRIVRVLVREHGIDIVHQPIPVAPKEPSIMHRVPAPLVIGPLNGGMSWPAGFRDREGRFAGRFMVIGRILSSFVHAIFRGKRNAALILVANERTRRALPKTRARVVELVENGVDLNLWKQEPAAPGVHPVPRFVYMGRLVDWKAVDLLLDAVKLAAGRTALTLDIIGDGNERAALEQKCDELGLRSSVRFRGWLAQSECARELRSADAMVLPSLYECGGAVVLEAMACGLPVIATRWGGPADYLDATCGILVDPTNPADFTRAIAAAMEKLATDGALRRRMGAAGRQRIERDFDWNRKIDRILELYEETKNRPPRT